MIHKGEDLPRDDLNNRHPISLTKTDYKIMAKCLSRRLSNLVGDTINEDQVRFVNGQNVSTLIKLIDDTINYLNKTNLLGILLAVDYCRHLTLSLRTLSTGHFSIFDMGNRFANG